MSDDLNRQIAAAARTVMDDHGITQTQIAALIGKSQQYVSDRMGGKRAMSLDILGAIATLAHLSPRAVMVEITDRMARAGDPPAPAGTPVSP